MRCNFDGDMQLWLDNVFVMYHCVSTFEVYHERFLHMIFDTTVKIAKTMAPLRQYGFLTLQDLLTDITNIQYETLFRDTLLPYHYRFVE